MRSARPLLFAIQSSRKFGQDVSHALGIPLSSHEEREFDDGEHKIRPLCSVRNRDVYVIQSLYSDSRQSVNDKLCRLLFFLAALRDASAATITAVVPYLCYTRKDRQTKPRDPVTSRYIAQLFEAVRTDCILTMDVHNLAAFQNAFHRTRTEHLEASTLFARHLAEQFKGEDVVIASPDVGGIKRAEAFRRLWNETTGRSAGSAFLEKRRSSGVVSGDALMGDVEGKTVLFVDDIISSGTTLSRAAQACRRRGAAHVRAAATHGVFVSGAEEALADPALERVFVTDTVPPSRVPADVIEEKVTVVEAAPLFAEAIRRMHEGGSVVELLEAGSQSKESRATSERSTADCPDNPAGSPKPNSAASRSVHPVSNSPATNVPYLDRMEAGRQLAESLKSQQYDRANPLVLALPRGGVPVAYQIAHALGGELDVLVVRKLGLPGQKELAMGAIASGGVRVRNPRLERIPNDVVDQVAQQELQELERRERAYRGDRPRPTVDDRCVILVDDGLATGSTMRAAIGAVRQMNPRRIVVAVPVGARETISQLRGEADDVVCPAQPEPFLAIGEFYEDFAPVGDEQVSKLLHAKWEKTPVHA